MHKRRPKQIFSPQTRRRLGGSTVLLLLATSTAVVVYGLPRLSSGGSVLFVAALVFAWLAVSYQVFPLLRKEL